MYDKGDGVQQDLNKAFQWVQKAAMQGAPEAQANLGWRYFVGRGVQEDTSAMLSWTIKAAEQGDAKAQDFLSKLNKSS